MVVEPEDQNSSTSSFTSLVRIFFTSRGPLSGNRSVKSLK